MYKGTSTSRKGEPNSWEEVCPLLATSAYVHVDMALELRALSHSVLQHEVLATSQHLGELLWGGRDSKRL